MCTYMCLLLQQKIQTNYMPIPVHVNVASVAKFRDHLFFSNYEQNTVLIFFSGHQIHIYLE